jgi:steroid 5-alpha reductase family enzyme
MTPLDAFLASVAVAVTAKSAAWLLQLRNRNAGLVDAVWAWTLGGLAALYAAAGSAPEGLRLLLAAMGLGWGLRLGIHLWRRNWGRPEDWRYAQFRARWGANADRNMFWFFQFQNVFTLLLAAAAFLPVAYRSDLPPAWAIGLALMLYAGGLLGEGIADRQMERFRAAAANRGQVCRDGLWRYSRHPNYFFECVHWCAYVPLALGAPFGWVSLGAPLLMAWLLIRLSGVPLMEAEMARRKPGYADYLRTTSMLIPWPPKSP